PVGSAPGYSDCLARPERIRLHDEAMESQIYAHEVERAVVDVGRLPGRAIAILIEKIVGEVGDVRPELDVIRPDQCLRREADPEPIQADILDARGRNRRSVRLDDGDIGRGEGSWIDGLAEPDV